MSATTLRAVLFDLDVRRFYIFGLILYPLSAFRAMNKAAEAVYAAIRRDGTQQNVIETMQTRAELYDRIGYHAYEERLDALFAQARTGTTEP
jgi:methylisocitrate lyase